MAEQWIFRACCPEDTYDLQHDHQLTASCPNDSTRAVQHIEGGWQRAKNCGSQWISVLEDLDWVIWYMIKQMYFEQRTRSLFNGSTDDNLISVQHPYSRSASELLGKNVITFTHYKLLSFDWNAPFMKQLRRVWSGLHGSLSYEEWKDYLSVNRNAQKVVNKFTNFVDNVHQTSVDELEQGHVYLAKGVELLYGRYLWSEQGWSTGKLAPRNTDDEIVEHFTGYAVAY
ncbi:hypothetical protein DFS34DRAFT_610767 [Phlyctochytrium arcticum]|nr:hypothetical protein DFS34DRAFT_610767 [Phlyctochytrium arcticum]